MLLRDKIKVKINPNSRKYYNEIGYKCNNYDVIDINIKDLPSGSNYLIGVKCDNCGIEKEVKYNKYYKATNNYCKKYFCKKCNYINAKQTKLDKYGDENYNNRKSCKKTKLDKYGDENYNNIKKIKKTNLIKYGVENVSEFEPIKKRRTENNIKKYGVGNVFQDDEVKQKIKDTCLLKYNSEYYLTSDDCKIKYKKFCTNIGVLHYSQSDEFKEKFKNTSLKNWGKVTNLLNEDVKKKIKITNTIKYGFDNAMKNKDISLLSSKSLIDNRASFFKNLGYKYISYDFNERMYKLERLECNHIFDINYDLFRSRVKYENNSCLVCFPKNDLSSIKEKELCNWLKSLNIEVIENSRKLLNGKELDIYLPEYKIAIEFNGLYYHSDKFKEKKYHINKTNECAENWISLIHIWEDDWMFKKEIVKSIILNKINLLNNKIYARNTKIKEVSTESAKIFLEENHIQGYTNSSVKIGLYYKNDLVSLMTFGKRRISGKNSFELIRYSNKKNTSVIGGASRLFKFFINNFDYGETIISYSDISLFSGKLYEKLGFINDGKTSLNYFWSDLSVKYHRFKFNKKKLVKMGYDEKMTEEQIMKNIGFHKIWSCGQIRWIYYKK